jgi:hypothetical protein
MSNKEMSEEDYKYRDELEPKERRTAMSMSEIDVKGIDRGALIAALHNGTGAQGLGMMHDICRDMTPEEGAKILDERNGKFQFDYLRGRPIKVWIEGDMLMRTDLYDRDARPGACQEIVDRLRKEAADGG